jgi:hypothetical protein
MTEGIADQMMAAAREHLYAVNFPGRVLWEDQDDNHVRNAVRAMLNKFGEVLDAEAEEIRRTRGWSTPDRRRADGLTDAALRAFQIADDLPESR